MPFINEEKIKLAPNAFLFCFTDGLVDIQNEAGEYFEEDKLKEFIYKNKDKPLVEFNNKLIETVEAFKGEREYVDDIALLTTKVI